MADEAATTTGAEATGAASETQATATTDTVLGAAAVAADATATEAKAADGATAETKADAAGDKGADTKDGKAEDAPIEYTDFTLPDGVEVDTATLGEAKEMLAGMKLPQAEAQKLVDFYTGKMKAFGEAQVNNWVKLNEKWVSEYKADAEIGGDKVEETLAAAKRAMAKFGTPGLRDALGMTGAGNHPEVIRFVARVGKATSEDTTVVAGGASAGQRNAADVLYPTQGKDG